MQPQLSYKNTSLGTQFSLETKNTLPTQLTHVKPRTESLTQNLGQIGSRVHEL